MIDTSKEYIKMNSCPEIQGEWEPKVGDWYYVDNEDELVEATICMNAMATKYERAYGSNMVWLPRQDQIQDMLQDFMWVVAKGPTADGAFIAFVDVPPGKVETRCYAPTAEQALLQLVMLEIHGKKWNGSEWVR